MTTLDMIRQAIKTLKPMTATVLGHRTDFSTFFTLAFLAALVFGLGSIRLTYHSF